MLLALLDRPILLTHLALLSHPALPALLVHLILILLALPDHPTLPALLVHPIHLALSLLLILLGPLPLLDHQINHKVQVNFVIFQNIWYNMWLQHPR